MTSLTKNLKAKTKNFFYSKRHESLQGLNRSLAQSAAGLWLAKICPERGNHLFCYFLSKIRFLSHGFGSRYARKPFNGSKDMDFGLVSIKAGSKKVARWIGAQSQVNWAKKAKTYTYCVTTGGESKPERRSGKRIIAGTAFRSEFLVG